MSHPYRTALTVAGSDSGGGAGLQADLKTFAAHGVFGMTAITAVTAQSSRGVTRVDPIPVEGLTAQLRAVFDDFPVDVVKVGMLGSAGHAAALADVLEALPSRPPVVLDPVLVASTGQRLTDAAAEQVVRERLLPLATLATPNRDEAAVLAAGLGVEAWARSAPCAVLVTGGDVVGEQIVDRLYAGGELVRTWSHARQGTLPFHGTGCTLASAIAARLALGDPLPDAIDGAIDWLQGLIAMTVREGSIGHGNPSLHHAR
ncbi:MAG: bifunctional hydroxymethylpyrimidine kinase/phosphomethylpyrimidine kinase [Alphaproteobacteria bacterium]|nr:bifunctional hydroxymethylpyrimidine kinase/phosphomethylpyrimidine kinase [Alphaproteobacteria bacterium]